jgi:hypothetical protein
MNIIRVFSFAALVVAIGAVTADDKKFDMQAAVQAMLQHGTPGDAHKVLNGYAGKWNYSGKWYAPDGVTSMDMKGTAESNVVMDGRFYTESIKSTDPQMPFEGKLWVGHDNHTKKYWFCWIDSSTTSLSQGSGTWDAASHTMTWVGEMFDPYEKKNYKSKEVQVVKPDSIDKTFYRIDGSKETKEMELHYTRAK